MSTSTDRIEKKILLRASRARVWRALTVPAEFGAWFGMKFDGPFIPGKSVQGKIVPTQVDEEVATSQKPYEGLPVEFTIERMDAEQEFSLRWHPFAIDPKVDYSNEPTTLIVFALADAPGGILLTVTESGFDAIPLERRAKAFAANEGGWEAQTKLIEKYLAQSA
jgi:uncharacterized protein YndB with AHSA1/START domain